MVTPLRIVAPVPAPRAVDGDRFVAGRRKNSGNFLRLGRQCGDAGRSRGEAYADIRLHDCNNHE